MSFHPTIHRSTRSIRLIEAERLLAAAADRALPPLAEIAESAGFADAPAMDRAFRRLRRTTSYEFWLRQRLARRRSG